MLAAADRSIGRAVLMLAAAVRLIEWCDRVAAILHSVIGPIPGRIRAAAFLAGPMLSTAVTTLVGGAQIAP